MKLILFTLTLFAAIPAFANVPLAWDDPNNSAGTVVEYRVYANGELKAQVTEKTADIDLGPGQYAIYVTAVNAEALESLPSNEVQTALLVPPINVRIDQTGLISISQ